jgi:RNA polymerase sigma-54 factor
MGPAIALRLRQHLTLTPQVQQALKLLQMSALEFGQEMEEALAVNPFLEENPEAQTPPLRDAATVDDVVVPQEQPSGPPMERDQEDWGGANESQPTLQQHLREQLMISPMGERDRALAHMIIDSLDDDGYFKMAFDELAALVPPEHDVRPDDFLAALRMVQSLDPAGIGARTLDECLLLQLQALPEDTKGREVAMRIVQGNLPLLANREWARLQHAVGCDELRPAGGALCRARHDRQEAARPLGRDHQPGVAAARAPEPRLCRGDPEPQRLEPVARAPSAGGALAVALDRAALRHHSARGRCDRRAATRVF